MRPATIRRLLVFGVCLVGVGCLYLVPSMAGGPARTGATAGSSDLPTTAPPATALVTAISASPTASASTDGSVPPTGSNSASRTASVEGSAATRGDGQRSMTGRHSGATAVDPDGHASTPPEVGRLTLVSADPEDLVVSWPEVDDDDLVGYEVWLNGFFVVTVQHPRAKLGWFNDTDTHVIQVRALDAAGHEGPSSPTLLVMRPAPPPEPNPAPASPSTTPSTTDPSSAPAADDENADAPLNQTTGTSSATTSEAGGTEEESHS